MVSLWRSRFYPVRVGGVLCRCYGALPELECIDLAGEVAAVQ
jgi:hypothetical protein